MQIVCRFRVVPAYNLQKSFNSRIGQPVVNFFITNLRLSLKAIIFIASRFALD